MKYFKHFIILLIFCFFVVCSLDSCSSSRHHSTYNKKFVKKRRGISRKHNPYTMRAKSNSQPINRNYVIKDRRKKAYYSRYKY